MAENQRVRMSKQLLRNSLLRLMKVKSIYKISITEICELAEVNRSTFYKYYGTEFDLLQDLENEYLNIMHNALMSSGTILEFINYIDTNIETFHVFCRNSPDNNFFRKICDKSIERVSSYENKLKIEWRTHKNYVYQFVMYGFFNIIVHWVNSGRETPEELNNILTNLMSVFFTN